MASTAKPAKTSEPPAWLLQLHCLLLLHCHDATDFMNTKDQEHAAPQDWGGFVAMDAWPRLQRWGTVGKQTLRISGRMRRQNLS